MGVSRAEKSSSKSCLVTHASSARAATLYAVIVSSWYGRFCLFVRERGQLQNSLVIIARSA
jgi:hypothetical protein